MGRLFKSSRRGADPDRVAEVRAGQAPSSRSSGPRRRGSRSKLVLLAARGSGPAAWAAGAAGSKGASSSVCWSAGGAGGFFCASSALDQTFVASVVSVPAFGGAPAVGGAGAAGHRLIRAGPVLSQVRREGVAAQAEVRVAGGGRGSSGALWRTWQARRAGEVRVRRCGKSLARVGPTHSQRRSAIERREPRWLRRTWHH